MPARAVSTEAHAEQRLSLQTLRKALSDPARRLVLADHQASLLAHPKARGLAGLSPGFSAAYHGRLELLTVSLAKALRAGGDRKSVV